MAQIVLSDDQLKAVRAAVDTVAILDQQGKLIGHVARLVSDEEIAAAKRRLESDGPWYPTKQVLDHLDSLSSAQ